jgi:hypothetical protein
MQIKTAMRHDHTPVRVLFSRRENASIEELLEKLEALVRM